MQPAPDTLRGPALPDLHIHTTYCQHAVGTMEETVLRAVEKGLPVIGFSDHFPYPPGFIAPAPRCVIPSISDFRLYESEVRRLRESYAGRIDIRFAAEVDFLDGWAERQAALLEPFEFDYRIGSVHIVKQTAVDYREDVLLSAADEWGGVEAAWDLYWDSMDAMIRRGGFHIVGHFDLLKKYPGGVSARDHAERVRGLFSEMKSRGLVLELNTGGVDRASDHRPYPSPDLLALAAECGVEVTLGSDAHAPEDVGRHFAEAAAALAALGWTRTVSFKAGEKRYHPIPG
jgi:histidinol-phosphatase (PHP family)